MVVLLLVSALAMQAPAASASPSPAPLVAPPPAPGDARSNEELAVEVTRSIAGREDKPAAEVFKNIQLFDDMPAGRLPRVMEGFSRSLGQKCAFCHLAGDWASDEKDHKRIARGMVGMVMAINQEHLRKIADVPQTASVSCMTCHRGEKKPAAFGPGGPRPSPPTTAPGAAPASPAPSPSPH